MRVRFPKTAARSLTPQYFAFGSPVVQSSDATTGSLSGYGPATSWSAVT